MTPVYLTARQRQLLDFIRAYQAEHRATPSFEEMREGLGLNSKSRIHSLLGALEERGCITRMHNRARAIEVAPDPHLMGREIRPVRINHDPVYPDVIVIPLHGRIS